MNWQTKQAKQNLSKLTPVQRWKEFERLLTEGAKAKGWSVTLHRVFGGKTTSCLFHDSNDYYAEDISDQLVLCAPDLDAVVKDILGKVTLATTVPGVAPEFAPPVGFHHVGDMVCTVDGALWTCASPGIPGTWVKAKPAPPLLATFTVDTTAYQEALKKAQAAFITPQYLISQYIPAALDGVWYTPSPPSGGHPTVDALAEIVPTISTARARCPQCLKGDARGTPPVLSSVNEMPLANAIVHLNDHHRWTREQIADWLDLLDVDLSIRQKEVA